MPFPSLHHWETGKILRIIVFDASTYTICFCFLPKKNNHGGTRVHIRITGGNHFIIKPIVVSSISSIRSAYYSVFFFIRIHGVFEDLGMFYFSSRLASQCFRGKSVFMPLVFNANNIPFFCIVC